MEIVSDLYRCAPERCRGDSWQRVCFLGVPPKVVEAAPAQDRKRVMAIVHSDEPVSRGFPGMKIDSAPDLHPLPFEEITAPPWLSRPRMICSTRFPQLISRAPVFLAGSWSSTTPAAICSLDVAHRLRERSATSLVGQEQCALGLRCNGIQEGRLSQSADGRALRPRNCHHGHAGASLPVVLRRLWRSEFRAQYVGLRRNKPIRESSFADKQRRSHWLDEMRNYGRRAR